MGLYAVSASGVGAVETGGFATRVAALEGNLGSLVGGLGADAARAGAALIDADARLTAAVSRRESVSGVTLDEEMTRMIAYQNSYAAAARIITTARDMYDILLRMGA